MRLSLKTLLAAAALTVLGGCADTARINDVTAAGPAVAAPAADRPLALARDALAERRFNDARAILDRVLVTYPTDKRARVLRAEVSLATGRLEAAAAAFGALTSEPAVSARAHQGLGLARLRAGDRTTGCDALATAVTADPALWRGWNGLGVCRDADGRRTAAETAYRKAIDLHPAAADAWNNLGYSYLADGRYADAVAALRAAIARDRDHGTARNNLRLALAAQGDYARAARGVDQAHLPGVLNNIGYVALMRGDAQAAEAYFERAMDADPAYNKRAAANLRHLRESRPTATGGGE